MPGEDRRRKDDENWDGVNRFIEESRAYRAADSVSQKYQEENLEALKNAVQKQNGRVFELEKWREEVKNKIKDKKDYWSNVQAFITVTATVIMAAAAAVMYFKK